MVTTRRPRSSRAKPTPRQSADLARELTKVLDAVKWANAHFAYEAWMNAALHMSNEVRPAPLAAAIRNATADLERIIGELG